MKSVRVKEIKNLVTPNPSLIGANAPAVQAVEAILRDPKTRVVHVVDKNLKLLGSIDIKIVIRTFLPDMFDVDLFASGIIERLHGGKASDLISGEPVSVNEECDLESALKILIENNLDELPVVDNDGTVIGELNILEILSIWLLKTQG